MRHAGGETSQSLQFGGLVLGRSRGRYIAGISMYDQNAIGGRISEWRGRQPHANFTFRPAAGELESETIPAARGHRLNAGRYGGAASRVVTTNPGKQTVITVTN